MAAATPRSTTKPVRQKSVRQKSVLKQSFDPLGASLVRANEMDWIGTHAGVKMLRISKETGWIAALVRGRAGQVNPPHTHLGPACFYVIEGGFEFRGGAGARRRLGLGTRRSYPSRDLSSGRYRISLKHVRPGDVP